MIVLGIDPGIATVGFGVISYDGKRLLPLEYGSIITKAGLILEKRLEEIYDCFNSIMNKYRLDYMAIEELFFNTNTKTAIDVAQARGVMLLAAQKKKIPVYEYTPLQVKQAVVGYGRAEKKQVMYMTKTLLNLTETPKPDDTADALAIAICHAHTIRFN